MDLGHARMRCCMFVIFLFLTTSSSVAKQAEVSYLSLPGYHLDAPFRSSEFLKLGRILAFCCGYVSFAPFDSKLTFLTTLVTHRLSALTTFFFFFSELTTSASKSKWPTRGTFNCWLPLMPCGSQQFDWISVGSTKDLPWSEWKGGAVDVFSGTIIKSESLVHDL